MEILNLRIRNFLTIGQADLSLNGKGLVLIQGENQDDTSATSNGVGKSSIPDALCWSLYGTTARGESGDAIVNRTAKKDCWVEVILKDGATFYEVRRYRKDRTNKNSLEIRASSNLAPADAPPGEVVSMHKGTEKETQEVINGIMGCSLDVFAAAVYAGQEQMPDLPKMTDKQLKMMIEEAAGVDRLETAYVIARDKLLTAERALTQQEMQLDTQKRMQAASSTNLVNAKIQQGAFEGDRQGHHDLQLQEAERLKGEMLKLALEIKKQNEAVLTARRTVLDGQLAGYRVEQEKLSAHDRLVTNANNAAVRAESEQTRAEREVIRVTHSITHLGKKVGTPCLDCGKTYAPGDLVGAKDALDKQLAMALAEHESARALVVVEKGTTVDVVNERDAFAATLPDVSGVNVELRQITDTLAQIVRKKQVLQTLNVQRTAAESNAAKALTAPNPYNVSVQQFNDQLDKHAKEIDITAHRITDNQGKVALSQATVKVFGPAGVRAHILDTVTPFLNDKTSEYLSALSDGNISAVWSTLSTTAKGEVREKFNIEVTHAKGGDSFGLLSGGEKRKVRLATMLALQDLVAARAIKPINIWIGDEIDDALDRAGLERLMDLLDRKAKERGTVLVISHNDLADWVDQVATVIKHSGYSTVSGAL